MNKRVLITGAAGFLGSNVFRFFLNKGFTVFGVDRTDERGFFCIDLLNEDSIIDTLKRTMPDIIIHCAGTADVGKSVQYPDVDYKGNVTVTHNLLFSLHKLNMSATKVVFLSSASVYGNPKILPITEDMPLNPLSPYALHKVMCEDICNYFCLNYNFDIKIARIFSAYGVGLRKQIFWDMYVKAKKTGKLEMFGTGNESRDYINVKDVVRSLFLLATKESNDKVFNIANGSEITIKQVTEWFAESSGISKDKILFNGHSREGEPINWVADISKIKKLGYKKSIEIKDGIKEYVDWVMR